MQLSVAKASQGVAAITPAEYIGRTPGGHGACPGCGLALALRLFAKAMDGRMIMVIPPGCTPVTVMSPRFNATFDVFVSLFGSTAVFASGLRCGLELRGETEVPVVGWGGDGATYDIGFQALSGAAERNEDIIYVCCDNEAYQNTGNQRSSATPWGATTSTNPAPLPKSDNKKDIMGVLAAHRVPYAATATVAYPQDLMAKVKKAREMRGFRFIQILAPCVAGWMYPPQQTVMISRLAVESKVFPLFEVEQGVRYTINHQPQGEPVAKYLDAQKRYRHLTPDQKMAIQQKTDEDWHRLQWLATYEVSRRES